MKKEIIIIVIILLCMALLFWKYGKKESVIEDYQNFSTCGLHLIEEEAPLYQLGAFEPSYKFDVSINEQPLNALPFNVGLKPQCSQEKTYI